MEIFELSDVYKEHTKYLDKEFCMQGWIRNHRKQKEFGFIDFHDGTHFKSIQVVYDNKLENFDFISKLHIGSAITVNGKLITSPADKQDFEFQASNIVLEGDCPEDYPLQPKRHTREFLRTLGYLRPRTNLFQAIFRVRSIVSEAIHKYYQGLGYVYVHTPIITSSDCEGAGEMFKVTTLDEINSETDYKDDFFGKKASLTVSGQLQGEAYAMCYKKIYTFGPTFRAENSNTKTHASEFWMIEPEIAFCDLDKLMDIEEDTIKYVIKYVLDKAAVEMDFFDKFVEEGLISKLKNVLEKDSVRITHEEAINLLINSKTDFENKPVHGGDLATEHEKYLTSHFNSPVFVRDWPKEIKSFYMRSNEDGKTVAAVDLLVPGAGELCGGSQREERLDVLLNRMSELGVSTDDLDWYINLRKYGGCKHSGFGLGFERLLIYLTGVENIRDVIPFPRTPNSLEF